MQFTYIGNAWRSLSRTIQMTVELIEYVSQSLRAFLVGMQNDSLEIDRQSVTKLNTKIQTISLRKENFRLCLY